MNTSAAVFTQHVINALHALRQSKELTDKERDLIQCAYNCRIRSDKVAEHIASNRKRAAK